MDAKKSLTRAAFNAKCAREDIIEAGKTDAVERLNLVQAARARLADADKELAAVEKSLAK